MNKEIAGCQALFFDGGSTLIDEKEIYRDRVERTIKENRLALTYDDFLARFKEASEKRLNPYIYACEKLAIAKPVGWNFSLEELYPGVLAMLKELKKRYRLAIVANQPPHFDARVARLGLAPYFEAVIGSEDYGVRKPDPAIFQLALDQLGLRPGEAAMIGDRLENDITPAKKMGLKTIWVKQGLSGYQTPRNEEEKASAVIGAITDLPQLLF
jgi:HAD superfamily hydrolase (TIGR01662 family)